MLLDVDSAIQAEWEDVRTVENEDLDDDDNLN